MRDFKNCLKLSISGLCLSFSIPAVASSPLEFDPSKYVKTSVTVGETTIAVRAYENLSYVAKPVEPEYQTLNVYIPEAYFEGKTVGKYSATTAPIFLPNQVGGYMPAKPGKLSTQMGPPGSSRGPSASAVALSRGLVVASPGARGRTLRKSDGTYTGKAPAAIVDLKAAVRYLRFNDARMPGNAEAIVSNGTSAGGALSALLGASGNSGDFVDALKALGAAPTRDDIFAVSAYCPITNLDHADAAYEWQFRGIRDFSRIQMSMLDFNAPRTEQKGVLSAAQVALSESLSASFPKYVNDLKLTSPSGTPLRLVTDGQGSFKDYVKSFVLASAQTAFQGGADLSPLPWVTIQGSRVSDIDFAAYLRYLGRMKLPPAFDGVALDAGENQLFGDARIDARHFTAFSQANSSVSGAQRAEEKTVRQMNPMTYIGTRGATTARRWRIRHGTKDRDTSLAVPVLLATALQNKGYSVDFALPWDRPHSGDYDLDELFAWIDRIVTKP